MNEIKELNGRKYTVYLPWEADARSPWPIILLNGDPAMAALLEQTKLLPLRSSLAVMTLSENRLDDYTPWPERALDSRFPDFGGKADDYLFFLAAILLPHIKSDYPVCDSPRRTGILGQSLGGLLALYSQTVPAGSFFRHAAAISPSCWYPDFLPYMERKLPEHSDTRWFISCGTEEGRGHADIKQHSVLLSRRMMECLTVRYGDSRVFTRWDDGGHHDYLPQRYSRALSWMERGLEHAAKQSL